MPSRRQERIAKRVIQELVEAVRNIKNADFGFLTFTRCEMSPDLRHAKVFVSIFGSEEQKENGLAQLRQNTPRLRRMIGRPLGIKVLPEIHFEFDDTLETADRISRLIREARSTDMHPEPLTPEEADALRKAGAPVGTRADGAALDPFELIRMDVQEELELDDQPADDPAWQPIDLDSLPDEEDDG